MQINEVLGSSYRLVRPIGAGGVGTIWLAYHLNLQKYVIVKKVHDNLTRLVNCRLEVDILKKLHHQFLPQVYDFLELPEGIFTVMDYIPGQDLQTILDARVAANGGYYPDTANPFSEEQLVIWLEQLCDVLSYLHSSDPPIIHCDIKPGNIMISDTGNICLIDFNISLDGRNSKDLVGVSSVYASPEQLIRARALMAHDPMGAAMIDVRSDIYSLGAVFYRLMSGCVPIGSNTMLPADYRQVDPQHIVSANMRLQDMKGIPYSDGLCGIVDKMMQPDPAARFKQIDDVKKALAHLERFDRSYRKLTRIGRIADAAAIALSALFISLMVVGWQQQRSDRFFDAYESFMSDAQDWLDEAGSTDGSADLDQAGDDLINTGRSFLNDRSYASMLSRYPDEKADVLYAMGRVSLQQGLYGQAVRYFESSEKAGRDDGAFYRDLAIAYAADGQPDAASDCLSIARREGLDSADIDLVEARIAFSKKDYNEAYTLAANSAVAAAGTEIGTQAGLLALEASAKLGNTEACIDLMNSLSSASGGSAIAKALWQRKSAELCVQAAEQGQTRWLDTGIASYKSLKASGAAGLSDLHNLVWLYEQKDDLEACRTLLIEMTEMYPEDYRTYLRLSYISYKLENQKSPNTRDFTDTSSYYDTAVSLFTAGGGQISGDLEFSQMKEIIDLLRENGWLK